ncbi:MAG: carbamate kinase [Candidatus Micrarchaeota archaeon]|nr:carbamate kinase [Candidatus Micrarchaeota archaeon]
MDYLLAIGGNAVSDDRVPEGLCRQIVELHRKGIGLVITHGNGPQVGELSMKFKGRSLAALTAETETALGMAIEEGIQDAAESMRIRSPRTVIVPTRVVVDRKSAEFRRPTKPIGSFVDAKEAMSLRKRGFAVKRLANGYRRVVPSPKPEKVVDIDVIRRFLHMGYIVIAGGGGGIAVDDELRYVDAVIDKDRTSAMIAEVMGAKRLYMLTNVDGAYLGFGRKNQKLITAIKAEAIRRHVKSFEEGSMRPKVEAAVEFVKGRKGRIAVIGNLRKADAVMALKGCTVIRS